MENKKEQYIAPEVEVIECQVERGFAVSDPMTFSFGDDIEDETVSTKQWWFKQNQN